MIKLTKQQKDKIKLVKAREYINHCSLDQLKLLKQKLSFGILYSNPHEPLFNGLIDALHKDIETRLKIYEENSKKINCFICEIVIDNKEKAPFKICDACAENELNGEKDE